MTPERRDAIYHAIEVLVFMVLAVAMVNRW